MNATVNASMAMLNVEQLSLHYPDSPSPILQSTSLTLSEGEIACLLGASGCGKTSLLRCIAGFEVPSSGDIRIASEDVFNASHNTPIEQRHIGMVFQDYALFPHLSVVDNIAFGLNKKLLSKEVYAASIKDTLSLLDLDEHGHKYPHQLSGGQQQRVAIGRAIASKPKILLLDEPLSNLDVHLRERLAHDLRDLLKSQGITALMVTHDQQEAFAFADKIGVMHQGKIEQWGTAAQIYHQPETAYVAKFIGDGTVFSSQQAACLQLDSQGKSFVLVRPEHINLDKNGALSATIVHVHNQGHSHLLRCCMHIGDEENVEILMRCKPMAKVEAGQTINFNIDLS